MSAPTPVTDADMAREFRLRHVRGSSLDAITHPALRICLARCAEARHRHNRQQRAEQPTLDGKRLAAGDID